MLVDDQEKLIHLLECLRSSDKPVVIDTETSWESAYQDRFLLGISIFNGYESFYIPVGHQAILGRAPRNLQVPSTLLLGIGTELIFHNALFDMIVLDRAGILLPDVKIYDTMLMSHLIDEDKKLDGGHELSAVGMRYVGRGAVKEVALKKFMKAFGWECVPTEVMARYAEQDARLPYDIYHKLKLPFMEFEKYWEREFEITKVIKKMTMKGLPSDVTRCRELEKLCEQQVSELITQIGFDPGKRNIAKTRLFSEPPIGLGIIPTHFTGTGDIAMGKEFLEELNHPIAGLIKQHNATKKQLTSYYHAYLKRATDEYPRLHAGFKQHGTVSGRWSCEDPNLQQIPRESPVKKLFLAEEGKQLWEVDYSNIEWRMGALYSQEKILIDAFENGLDMHMITAKALNVSRQAAKIGGFTWLFAGGWAAIVEQIGASEKDAKAFIKNMEATYAQITKTKNMATQKAKNTGYVKIWTGRKRHYNDPRFSYTAFNFLTQGGSFEIVKESLLKADAAGFDVRNCVHDSLWVMVDNKKEVEELEHIMSDWTKEAFGLHFPVESKQLN